MGKNRVHNILFALPFLFAACNTAENVEPLPPRDIPINFHIKIPAANVVNEYSRVSDLTEDMGVFAYLTQGNFNQATAMPNYMYNQRIQRNSDGGWSYSPIKYWPGDQQDRISFCSYAPYADSTTAASTGLTFQGDATASSFPVLDFVVPAKEEDQTDLLVSTPLMNQTYETNKGSVKFDMHHALTKVIIYVKSDDDAAGKKITAFSIKGTKDGSLTYHAPLNVSDKGFEWTYSSAAEKETFLATATNFAVPDKSTAAKKLFATFYLLPRSEGNTFSLTYTYIDSDNGSDIPRTVAVSDKSLPLLDQWKEGAFISYTIGISNKIKVSVTPSTHPSWEEGESETVNGTIN